MSHDVCVIGLGYIGLPTAALFANSGLRVLGVDINESRIAAIKAGNVETTEPGLADLLNHTRDAGLLEVATAPEASKAYVIAVPTPFADNKHADLSYLLAAAHSIGPVLEADNLVIIESTSPPSTTELVKDEVLKLRPDLNNQIRFAYCPERILPGRAFNELRSNDRVIGGLTLGAAEDAAALYRSFCKGKLHLTDAASAELVKLAENSFRDVNIAFANELSLLCDSLGVDPWEVIRLANQHPRVNILNPGPGVGGHCIAVDPWFLAQAAPERSTLIQTARKVNDEKPKWVIEKTERYLDRDSVKNIALLGLTFKPNIDDLRESPALEIAHELAVRNPGFNWIAVEPNIDSIPEDCREPNLVWTPNVPTAESLQLIVWLVGHEVFESMDWGTYSDLPLIDTRGNRSRNLASSPEDR